ncbi:MAG: type I restriction endonuclease [Bullifex sp.]
MEISDTIKSFVDRLEKIKDSIQTEEATKTSMIMPLFSMLGYDVFNPLLFVPEYTADVGMKKKEKVDYAIIVDGKPLIFIECKACTEDLAKHDSQLIRYFNTTPEAKFGILTNGLIYKFFTDLEKPNVMDQTPFLTIDLLNLQERDINELKKFSKDALDVDNILSSAENLKYINQIKDWFKKEINDPDVNFVKLILTDIYEGTKGQKVIAQFTPLVKSALQQFIKDSVNQKIQNALNSNKSAPDDEESESSSAKSSEKKIETTLSELEGFGIVKSILRNTVDIHRVVYRDAVSYFGILLDDNRNKWICRLYLNGNKKFISVPGDNKTEVRLDIENLDDIYNYSQQIIEACTKRM